jgi:hypothetical protein
MFPIASFFIPYIYISFKKLGVFLRTGELVKWQVFLEGGINELAITLHMLIIA